MTKGASFKGTAPSDSLVTLALEREDTAWTEGENCWGRLGPKETPKGIRRGDGCTGFAVAETGTDGPSSFKGGTGGVPTDGEGTDAEETDADETDGEDIDCAELVGEGAEERSGGEAMVPPYGFSEGGCGRLRTEAVILGNKIGICVG